MKIELKESGEAKFEMTPMIDMVFLLLIFFMCASHLSVMQNLELEIPTAEHAVVPKDRPDRFVVNIKADGTVHGGNVEVDIDGLKAMVKEMKNVDAAIKVYVRADKETEHRHIRKVMAAMAELGIDDFIFGAFKPSG